MTITVILLVVAVLALIFLIRVAKDQGTSLKVLDNPTAHMRVVDIEAFRNLIDPAEREFLRERLRPRDFRRIQRERLRAAVEYIFGAAHNAGILLRVSEAASRSTDLATVVAADKLRNDARLLRLYALQASGKLCLAMIFPGASIHALHVAESYEQMTRKVVMLGLRYPTKGISAAL